MSTAANPEAVRVLVVEDSSVDAEMEARELKRAGIRLEMRVVDGEEEFRRALAEFAPHVILSDFSMPSFSGMDALAIARKLTPEVPFIFVSGTLGEEYAIRALKNGATDYVLKTNLARLPAAVERALQDVVERAARRQAEGMFRNVVEFAPDPMVVVNAAGEIVLANAEVERLFGYPRSDILGRPVDTLVPAARRAGHGEQRAAYMREPRRRPMGAQSLLAGSHRDGREIPIEVSLTPIGEGPGTMVVATIRDLTERRVQEARIARLSRVREFTSSLNSTLVRLRERGAVFEAVCRIARESGEFPLVFVAMVDRREQQIRAVAWAGEKPEFADLSRPTVGTQAGGRPGLTAQAIARNAPVVCNDIEADGGVMMRYGKEALAQGYRSAAALPLAVNGAAVGALMLYAAERQFFDNEEMKLLVELAGNISFALEHIEKEERIGRLSRVNAVLSGINGAIVRIRDRQELFRESCRIAVEHGKFPLAWIGLVSRAQTRIELAAWAGEAEGYLERMPLALNEALPQGRSMTAQAIRERKAAVAHDMATDARVVTKKEALERGFRSLAILPLVAGGEAVGVLSLYAEQKGFFDDEEMKLLAELAGDISFALEHIAKAEQLDYLAYYDALTGLANRTLFHERLSHTLSAAGREQHRLALAIFNLERFKTINDAFGRQAGDALLKQVAARLGEVAGGPTHAARLGADHFGLVIPHVESEQQLTQRLEESMRRLDADPYRIEDAEIRISIRAGIALFPADGAEAESLSRHAEAALKRSQSGDRYVFYAKEMTERVAEKLALENKLRRALENDEFVLHYQPKVDLETRSIVGVEALIRWQSPELGLVPPLQFIPLMEETGLILPVGAWALRQAALDHRRWVEQGARGLRVAVNVSAIQLRQRDFVEIVEQAIIDGLAPTGIDLEITESVIMEDIQRTVDKLESVRKLGVRIAIDDFGTGYSSLAYLARLPVETLKIDRSFVVKMLNDPNTATLVQTVISLAHALRLKVVAEGVDSEEQANLLRLLRCEQMQGYLISKPLPAEQLAARLGIGGTQAQPPGAPG
jgi:diguanylate cyclase (GGDEF)-like protein/PAS domain S-box-containing protein